MDSIAQIEELELKFGENPRRYFAALANAYRRRGDLDRAIDLCRVQLAQQPGHLSGHVVLGQALHDAGRDREARDELERALEIDPENFIALRLLGELSARQGDREGARAFLARALDIEPRNEQVVAALAALQEVTAETTPAEDVAHVAEAAAEPVADPVGVADEPFADPNAARFDIVDAAVAAAEPAAWAGEVETSDYETEPRAESVASPIAAADEWESATGGAGTLGVEPVGAVEDSADAAAAAQPLAPAERAGEIADDAEEAIVGDRVTTEDERGATVTTASGKVLLSETMADLYLAQGHRADAADVIRKLLEQRPDDERLRRRLAELEPAPRATVRELFARVATKRVARPSPARPLSAPDIAVLFAGEGPAADARAHALISALTGPAAPASADEFAAWLAGDRR